MCLRGVTVFIRLVRTYRYLYTPDKSSRVLWLPIKISCTSRVYIREKKLIICREKCQDAQSR